MTSGGTALRKAGAVVASALLAGLLTLTLIFFIQDAARPRVLEGLSSSAALTPADVEQIFTELGLDRPLPQRWADFMTSSVRLDFGQSFSWNGGSVRAIIASRAWPSLLLLTTGMFFAIGLARLSSIAALKKPWGRLDKISTSAAVGTGAVPFHFLAMVALLVFAVGLPWFPISGYLGDPHATGLAYFTDVAHHLSLPALCLGLVLWGMYHVWFRTLAFEALTVSGRKAVSLKGRRQAARESWIPFLRLVLMSLGYAVVGLFLVEEIFTFPGVGKLFFDSISKGDAPTFSAILVVVCVPLVMISAVTRSMRERPASLDASPVGDRPRPRRRRALVAGCVIIGAYLLVVFGGTLLIGADQASFIRAAENDQPIGAAPGWRCPQSYTSRAQDPGTEQWATVPKPCPSSERQYYPLGTDNAGVSVLAKLLWEGRRTTLAVGVILLIAAGITALLKGLSRIGGRIVRSAAVWLADWTTSLPAAPIVAVTAWYGLGSGGRPTFRIIIGCLLWGMIGRDTLRRGSRSTDRSRYFASVASLGAYAFFTLSAVETLVGLGYFYEALASGAPTGGEWWWWQPVMIATIVPILGARLIAFGLTPAPVRIEPDAETEPEPGLLKNQPGPTLLNPEVFKG